MGRLKTAKGAPNLGSMADHQASYERQTGKRMAVAEPEAEHHLPEVLAHVWGWYEVLGRRRTGSGVGPNPLTFQEVEAWSRLMQVDPDPWEVHLLLRLDDVMLDHMRGGPKDGS